MYMYVCVYTCVCLSLDNVIAERQLLYAKPSPTNNYNFVTH